MGRGKRMRKYPVESRVPADLGNWVSKGSEHRMNIG